MGSHDSKDKFWVLPAEKFSHENFIHLVEKNGCSVQLSLNSQELSSIFKLKDEGNSTYSSTFETLSPQESSEKNSSSITFNGVISSSEKSIEPCNNHTNFVNIGHPSDLSRFDGLLLQRWNEASAAGALNYDVDEVVTKILPGKYGIVAQLNPARAVKRRKPQPFTKINEPFNAQSFNFTKIKNHELLFNIHLSLSSGEEVEGSLIVNAAPICHSHSLLLPSVASCRPQVIDREGLLLAVSAVLLSNLRSFRVGFNSLCAYASVNHHHYHCYYLPYRVYVEAAACRHVHNRCYAFTHHYAPGFVFQADPDCVMDCISAVMKLLRWLVSAGVPHNVFITRGLPLDAGAVPPKESLLETDSAASEEASRKESTPMNDQASSTSPEVTTSDGDAATTAGSYGAVRVCVWARQPTTGAKDVSVFAPALCELAGHVPIYDPGEWEHLNEKDITDEIHSICTDAFNLVLSNIKNIL